MARLSIVHTTTYRYARPVGFNPHRLMLRPRGSQELQVLEHVVQTDPPADLVWSQDVFGNLVATARIIGRAPQLSVTSRLTLETSADPWPVFPIDVQAQQYPFDYTDDEISDLGALRGADAVSPAVGAWARSFIAAEPTDTLALLNDVNAGVLGAAAYREREEEGTQTPDQTLALGSGSCRDLAALFIDAARALGFGARAVSGYQFDPDGLQATPETTHAWAEVYVPGGGWIPFDPTHRRMGGGGLIGVAIGRCNAQILPLMGSYVGAPEDFLGLDVEVRTAVEA